MGGRGLLVGRGLVGRTGVAGDAVVGGRVVDIPLSTEPTWRSDNLLSLLKC